MLRQGVLTICVLLACINLAYGQADSIWSSFEWNELNQQHLRTPETKEHLEIVSASRSSKSLEDLPISAFVITHEEIIRNRYFSLADVLKAVAGIRTSQPGSAEIGETFLIRGLIGNYYVKILVNNVPVKPSVVTGMPVGWQLPVRQAERIEIIYGPAAAVYGADAVSGVINIITRKAQQGTFVQGDMSLGIDDFSDINFMIGGKAGKNRNILEFSFYGSKTELSDFSIKYSADDLYNPLNYLQNQGTKIQLGDDLIEPAQITEEVLSNYGVDEDSFIEQYYPVNYDGDLLEPAMQNLPASSHMMGLNLKFRGFTFSYHNMYRRIHSSIGRTPYLFKYNNPQNYWGENIHRGVIKYEKNWEKFNSSSILSYLSYSMDNNSSMGLTMYKDRAYRYAASDDFLAEQLITYAPNDELEIVSGFALQASGNLPTTNYQEESFKTYQYDFFSDLAWEQDSITGSFGYNPQVYANISTFLQFYYILNNFRFMGGIRYDNNTLYGDAWNPRFATLFRLGPRTTMRGSIGYAYKAPSPSITYEALSFPVEDAGSLMYIAAPNKNLNPENFRSIELGLKRKFFRKIFVDLSFFYNKIDNLIVTGYEPASSLDLDNVYYPPETDTVWVRTHKNVGDAQSTLYGVQTNINYRNIIESVKLNLEINLTLARQSEKLPEVGSIIGSFNFMPKHLGQLNLSFEPTKRIYVRFENVWMSKWLRVLIPIEEIYDDPYKSVDGYYTLDGLVNFQLSNNLHIYLKVQNVFDERYGSIAATGSNFDLPYNPQQGTTTRFGLTYNFN